MCIFAFANVQNAAKIKNNPQNIGCLSTTLQAKVPKNPLDKIYTPAINKMCATTPAPPAPQHFLPFISFMPVTLLLTLLALLLAIFYYLLLSIIQ